MLGDRNLQKKRRKEAAISVDCRYLCRGLYADQRPTTYDSSLHSQTSPQAPPEGRVVIQSTSPVEEVMVEHHTVELGVSLWMVEVVFRGMACWVVRLCHKE